MFEGMSSEEANVRRIACALLSDSSWIRNEATKSQNTYVHDRKQKMDAYIAARVVQLAKQINEEIIQQRGTENV